MAADLASTPRSGINVQACGDAHLSNFGLFGSPERRAAVRHQRLRRDPPRSVGVGREAPRGEPRRRRAEQRVLRRRARRGDHGLGRRVPDGHAGVRVDAQPRRLVRAPPGREGLPQLQALLGKKRASRRPNALVEKARTKDSIQAFDKLTRRRRRGAADRERPATHRPRRGVPDGRPSREVRGRAPRARAHLPSEPPRGSPAPLGGLPLRPRGAQGGRRGQRRHARVDRPHARSRRRRPAVPPGQGGPGLGARALRRQEPVRRTRASGWSRASA